MYQFLYQYFVFQVLVVIQQLFKLAEFLPTSICIAFLESCQKKPRVAIIHAEPITVQVRINHLIVKTSVLYFLFSSLYDCNPSETQMQFRSSKGLAVSIACSYLHRRTTSNSLQEVMHREYQGEKCNPGWSQRQRSIRQDTDDTHLEKFLSFLVSLPAFVI